jgi:hypothetical protein
MSKYTPPVLVARQSPSAPSSSRMGMKGYSWKFGLRGKKKCWIHIFFGDGPPVPPNKDRQVRQRSKRRLLWDALSRLSDLRRYFKTCDNQQCRLLRLPPEIRLAIYGLLFPCPTLVLDRPKMSFAPVRKRWLEADLGIIFVCKAIYKEATNFLYRQMSLRLMTSSYLRLPLGTLVDDVPQSILGSVTKVEVCISEPPEHGGPVFATDFSTMHGFPITEFSNLRHIALMVHDLCFFDGQQFEEFKSGFSTFELPKSLPDRPSWNRRAHLPFLEHSRDRCRARQLRCSLESRQALVFIDVPVGSNGRGALLETLFTKMPEVGCRVSLRHSYQHLGTGERVEEQWFDDETVRKMCVEDQRAEMQWALAGWRPFD